MKLNVYTLLFSALVLLGFTSKAQLANDDCFGATPLGTLGTPAACPSGIGAISTFNNLTNVNAISEQPYTTLINCQPDNITPMASPATDVWYSFVNMGNAINISINGQIQNPNIGLYAGDCNGLIGRGCAVGTGGLLTVTFDQMVIGQTYYLQISGGDEFDQGTFTMTLQNTNSCVDCLIASNLTVNPPPNSSGAYSGGTAVTFCYTITEWEQQNTNWFHGLVPNFGNGWDLTTLTNLQAATTCDGSTGVWQWFNNVTLPNNNGIQDGFFFDGDIVQEPVPDGDPTNNFGDNCTGTVNWTFCWTITTKACPPGQDGDDLGINIDTYGDGETGNWTNVACTNDPVYQFNAVLSCCAPPVMSDVDILCFGAGNGSATADAQGTGPFDYVWTNSSNVTIQTSNNQNGPNIVSNLGPGTYTVTVTDQNNGCVTTGTVTITEPTQLQLLVASTPSSCNQANGSATVTPQGGVGPYDFVWTDANGTTIQTSNNLPGADVVQNIVGATYNVTVTDANGCTATVAVVVQDIQGSIQGNIVGVDASCITTCDGTASVTVNGGNPTYNYVWTDATGNVVFTDNNSASTTSTAINLCVGTYTVNYLDINNCGGSLTVTIGAPPSVSAIFTASPQPTDIFDTRVYFTDRSTGGVTTWEWDFGGYGTSTDQNPSFLFPEDTPGCYDVTLTVDNGSNCPDSDTLRVCIDPNFVIYWPTAFTPNSDFVNNTFIASGEGIAKFEMYIFDRWGNKIYYCDSINKPWDGRKTGSDEICMNDVYVWRALVTDIFGLEHEYFGHVVLIR